MHILFISSQELIGRGSHTGSESRRRYQRPVTADPHLQEQEYFCSSRHVEAVQAPKGAARSGRQTGFERSGCEFDSGFKVVSWLMVTVQCLSMLAPSVRLIPAGKGHCGCACPKSCMLYCTRKQRQARFAPNSSTPSSHTSDDIG